LKIGCPRCTPCGELPAGGRAACGGTVAKYTGRGPVIGIITRRFSATGRTGASGAALLGGLLFVPVVAPPATGGAVVVSVGPLFVPVVAPPATGGAAGAAVVAAAAVALDVPAAVGRTAAGFTTTGALLGGAAEAIAGRASCAPAGGFATTGPTGGRDAIAGAAVTIFGPCRGCGTIFRGAFAAGVFPAAGAALAAGAFVTGAAGAVGVAFFAAGAATTGFAATGAAATAPRRELCDAVSSSFRCWIARSTSPGFEIFDRSIFGFGSAAPALALDFALVARTGAPPPKCARTRAVSSSVSELEWVFFSPNPISVRASINVLLFTSSSFANSLIRTFVIRPLTS
jgi:hypothetical protein